MTSKNIGTVSDPNMTDLMDSNKRNIFNTMNCIQLGTIQEYNPTTNMSKVSVNFKRVFQDGTELDYPLLCDCPTFILSGGGASISMPIAQGDQCLILFNDRNIDNWYLDGSVKAPRNQRAHSISDAIVLVGIRHLAIAAPTPIASLCVDGGGKKVSIKNNSKDLKNLITSLISTIKLITVTAPSGGGATTVPLNVAAFDILQLEFNLLLDEGLT